jgi:hypothetical protein
VKRIFTIFLIFLFLLALVLTSSCATPSTPCPECPTCPTGCPNTCVIDLINNTISPTNEVVTPIGSIANGQAAFQIKCGNYTCFEMKIKIKQGNLGGLCLLDIGDSPTNDGGGGDYCGVADVTDPDCFTHDAELCVGRATDSGPFNIALYGDDKCTAMDKVLARLDDIFPQTMNPKPPIWVLRVKIYEIQKASGETDDYTPFNCKICVLDESTGQSFYYSGTNAFSLGGNDQEAGGISKNDYVIRGTINKVIYTTIHPERTGTGVVEVICKWRNTCDPCTNEGTAEGNWEIP